MIKRLSVFLMLFLHTVFLCAQEKEKYVIAIHGGAGTILKSAMTPQKEKAYQNKLREALTEAYKAWAAGKTAVDVVQAAIVVMEDSPLFNAGKGSVFTHEGKNEMDAAIMNGSDMKAGAVAGVTVVKNPIKAARAVMERSEHVMMIGAGAEKLARNSGLEIVPPKYFYTEGRWEGLQKALREDSLMRKSEKKSSVKSALTIDHKFGTVGCVVLDKQGRLAAGTSTGGTTNKKYGRVGDVPIIGAGTYADSLVAVSCTGWGEYFIRSTVAHNIAARMAFKKESVKEASEAMLDQVKQMGGNGGLIGLDKDGNVSMPFNTEGMYRASVTRNGKMDIQIYK